MGGGWIASIGIGIEFERGESFSCMHVSVVLVSTRFILNFIFNELGAEL